MDLVDAQVDDTHGQPCFRITLTGPRANALTPALIDQLSQAFDTLEALRLPRAVLCGGRNFSSGGDVAGFHQAARQGQARDYADHLVPGLQRLVLRMLSMPIILVTAARGAVTGGAAGFLFAADRAVVAPDTFVQPYYSTVGFAPDGGWTAVLPERIGAGRATRWLLSDSRMTATDLLDTGLACAVDTAPEKTAAALLADLDVDSALSIKRLIWDDVRLRQVGDRLDAETACFRHLVGLPETHGKMARFLERRGRE